MGVLPSWARPHSLFIPIRRMTFRTELRVRPRSPRPFILTPGAFVNCYHD